jgi:hypothetical protein
MKHHVPRPHRHGSELLVVLAFATAILPTAPAAACSIVLPRDYEGSSQERRDVLQSIQNASAIVDGEVIQPWTTKSPALVRVHHVLRGIASEVIQVGGEGAGADCSIALERVGERSRMILNGGPEVFDLFYDQSEARLEDHFLKSDRRKVWPYFPGRIRDGN